MAALSWPRTEALITATFESPVPERERFLNESCTDPALRDGLIALLDTRNTSDRLDTAPAANDETAGLSAGSPVGPYIIADRIGRGGMGEVFLARDPRLDRAVALKCVLSGQAGGDDVRHRIMLEARAAAKITHPGIAAVHDVIEQDGRAFIVMEYVQGQSLAAVLQREPMAMARVVEIGWQLADALGAAHRVGIVHRDLKPGNVHVTLDGSVKILDFGIAMALATATTNRTRTDSGTSSTGRRLNQGTPPYMSPEQLLGLSVDQRTDLFSLAVVLFEMSTGRRPFESSNPFDILLATVRRVPRANDIDPRVPAALADVIQRGLSADPAERYQTAAEMAQALDRVRRELVAPTDERLENTRPRTRIGRGTLAALGLLTIPIWLWCLGGITTAAFNLTLGRDGAFASEPAAAYFVWGARSLVGPLVYATGAVGALWVARFVLQLLALSRPLAAAGQRLAAPLNGLVGRLSLDDARVFEPFLVTAGVLALAAFLWQFHGLIDALASNISTADPDKVLRLGPTNEDQKVHYRAVLTLLLLSFTAGLIHSVRLRARLPAKRWGSFAACAAIVLSILMLNEAPYRILWKNQAPRISYDAMRCYVIGSSTSESLIFCPDASPPRNRIVRNSDPLIHPTGVMESIFSPANEKP